MTLTSKKSSTRAPGTEDEASAEDTDASASDEADEKATAYAYE